MKKLSFLLLLFPVWVSAQTGVFDVSSMAAPVVTTATITLNVTSLPAQTTTYGTASSLDSFTVSGTNLTGSVGISGPTGYEFSTDGVTFTSTLSLAQLGGTLPNQPVKVYSRLSATAVAGSYSGFINAIAAGATTRTITVTGTVNPSLSVSPSSITGVNGISGTAGTPVTFTVTYSITSGNVLATAPTSTEISYDNTTYSSTLTFSGGTSILLYIRTQASAAGGSVSGNITFANAGFSTVSIPVSGTISTPTLTVTGSFSAFNANIGSPSASQTVTVSGTNLTNDCVITWPTGFEGSLNNSSYSSSQTITHSGTTLPSQPVTVYTRLASSGSANTFSGNVAFASSGATTVNKAVTGAVGSKDSLRVQFDTLTANNQSGWTIMQGDPGKHVITATGGNSNTLTVTSIATANWTPAGGNCAFPNSGTTSGTVWNYAPNVMKECWFQQAAYNSAVPQIRISGLKTGSTYSLQITASVSTSITGFTCTTDYYVAGSTTYGPLNLNAQPSGVENKTGSITFSSLTPDGSGNLNLFVVEGGGNLAVISAFILKEN